ncbi:glycosyltransferase family 4 protein [Geodermatophilus sp. SYSU D00758]
MRILVISPYPPQRDGIANYAAQAVADLMRQGHDVVVLSPQPSAAHLHIDFMAGPRAWAALARRARGFDKIVIQWHPAFFYRSSSVVDRSSIDLAMAGVFRLVPEVEIWVHEYEYAEVLRSPARRRAARAAFSRATLVFHSERERDLFLEAVPVDAGRTRVEQHGQSFRRRTAMGRDEARASLGIAPDEFVFLCIGFIQRHKGFDRAVRGFAALDAPRARLDVVGSTRLDEPEFLAHLAELELLTDQTEGARLHTGYVSDELFDRWILASDTVVLPYREIWSSGVLERAALFDRRVIASRVGGLEQQAGGRDVVFVDDDAALLAEMAAAAQVPVRLGDVATDIDDDIGWADLQATVSARAALARGSAPRATRPAEGPGRAQDVTPVDRSAGMVRRLPPYVVPPATSTRPGAPVVKRLVQRLTTWQIAPLASRVDQLQAATANSLDVVAAEIRRLREETLAGTGAQPTPSAGGSGGTTSG